MAVFEGALALGNAASIFPMQIGVARPFSQLRLTKNKKVKRTNKTSSLETVLSFCQFPLGAPPQNCYSARPPPVYMSSGARHLDHEPFQIEAFPSSVPSKG